MSPSEMTADFLATLTQLLCFVSKGYSVFNDIKKQIFFNILTIHSQVDVNKNISL